MEVMLARIYNKALRSTVYPFTKCAWLGTLTSVQTDQPKVALTFDDGPDPDWTPQLLDLLKKYDAKATFFVVGEAVEKHPDIVRRAVEEGHTIGNHSWCHRSLPTLSMFDQLREIGRCRKAIGDQGPRFFRPPSGHQTIRSRWVTALAREQVIGWSGHVSDWCNQTSQQLYDGLVSELTPGAIVLLHDGMVVTPGIKPNPNLLADRSAMLEALERILTTNTQALVFVTISELIHSGRPCWNEWWHFSEEAT